MMDSYYEVTMLKDSTIKETNMFDTFVVKSNLQKMIDLANILCSRRKKL